ncbi:hypothetical protein QBC45DRAFT_394826 [Copromyces sp. CBS 386.78]|nr:hypothetical protein QBC45DRAFT_394826 [Copromyces sp. CBS 386.78]
MVYEPKRDHRIDGPVNLLSLDGGGVRGISEVVMLHRIMKRVQQLENLKELPKPCEYFHIMGGTSTGGLRERQESTTGIDMEGDPAVYVTFDLSYLALRRQSRRINEDQHARDYETAMKILNIICFYHYDNIPEEMIMRAANWRAEILEKEAGGLQEWPIDEQLGGDTDRNANIIIELDEDRKDRLDTSARDRYGFTEKESYALSARCILFESIPETSRPEDFSYRTKLIPHGLALNEHAPPTAVGDMYREAYYDKLWAQANEDEERLAGRETRHPSYRPVSQANSTSYPPAPTYITTDLDPNDPTYLSEQADLWAQYSDYFSALDPLASESRDLFGRILHHMTIHKHLSCALRVAGEFYKRCVARDGPSAHSTSFYLMHLTAQTIHVADIFGAVERQEELVALCSKLWGPHHRNTRATKETLEVLKKNRDTRVTTMAQSRIIMKKYEDWKGKRSDAELRAEVGDERFEQKYREYVDANVANDRVPVENVCEVKGGCREKGFREVDRRMGISR